MIPGGDMAAPHNSGKPLRRRASVMQNILVVDDDRRVVNFLTIKLRASGFQVASATNSESAIERMKSFSPDLIVIDNVMPGRNGIDTIREVRKTSPVPAVLISGFDVDKDCLQDLGEIEFLPKPFDPDELVARIRFMTTLKSIDIKPDHLLA